MLAGGFCSGKWNHDIREGYGVMTYADGGVYTGNWDNDMRNGQGKHTFPPPTNEEYEGAVRGCSLLLLLAVHECLFVETGSGWTTCPTATA